MATTTESSSNALPPINDKRVFKRSMTVGSRGVNNLNVALMQSRNFDGQNIDDKLNEQYRYFRAEFMEAAHSCAVPVPLNIVDDKSGQFYKFVQYGGPKYLFDVIQSNTENIHLVRCSLSLLIIIVTLLRRKLPENYATKLERQLNKEISQQRGRQFHSDYGNMADPIATWVMDSLTKIGDATAVTVCVSVLVKSFNASIQELALTLLASLLSVSDEAVPQMLLPSNNIIAQNPDIRQQQQDSEPKPLQRSNTMKSERDHKKLKHLDYRKFDAAHLNLTFNHNDYSKKKKVQKKKRPSDKAATNLSLVLSLVLMQKNRHLLTAGCADVILAMLRLKTPEMCREIAETSTCEIPRDDEKNKSASRGSKFAYNPQPEEDEVSPPSAPLQSQIIEWAGLKLLLKFLFRFEKISTQSSGSSIVRDSVSASIRLKEEFHYAHERVFTAVCKLVGNSAEVAAYAFELPGAENLLDVSYARYSGDPNYPIPSNSAVTAAANYSPFVNLQQSTAGCTPNGGGSGGFQSTDLHAAYADCMQALQQANQRQQQRLQAQQQNAYGSPGAGHRESASSSGKRLRIAAVAASSNASSSPSKRLPRTAAESEAMAAALGSPVRRQVNSLPVKLVSSIEYDFKGEYDVQTEKKHLLKLNEVDKKHPGKSSASHLKRMTKMEERIANHSPLRYDPQQDNVMRQSLVAMNSTTERPIYSAPLGGSSADAMMKHHLLLSSDSEKRTQSAGAAEAAAAAVAETAATGKGDDEDEDDPDDEIDFMDRPADAVKDFFGRLPAEPKLPTRIEPRDVIVPGEDLDRIRSKFQQLAHKASSKIIDGVGYIRDGRNTVSQEERMRRIYAPNNSLSAITSLTSLSSAGSHTAAMANAADGHFPIHSRGGLQPPSMHNESAAFHDNRNRSRATATSGGGSEYADDFDPEGSADSLPRGSGSRNGTRPITGGGDADDEDSSYKPSKIYGLRLENVEFDEQNLFDGFKPIFDFPARPPEDTDKQRELREDFDSLEIGKKTKMQTEMDAAMDLLLP